MGADGPEFPETSGSGAPRSRVARLLAGAGLLVAGLAVLDPALAPGAFVGPVLAGLAIVVAPRAARARFVVAAVLAIGYGAAARAEPEFRADSVSYYAYLHSAVFDRDLDFANEWAHWGYGELPHTMTGLRHNAESIGPAVLWSPFFLAAHAYVRTGRALGRVEYAADGYTLPYRRSAVLGTVTAVVIGGWLLGCALARSAGVAVAALAVAAAVLASPIVYYALVVPTMAHGPAFGAAAALVWAWERARRAPSLHGWTAVGVLLGLTTLMRWQAAVYVLMVAPLALSSLRRRLVRPAWLLAAAAAGLVAFGPQLVAWKLLYGRLVTIPQGRAFIDWRSPHFLDTLLSADHGLFSWTPAMLLGLAGLVIGLRRDPMFSGSALAVFATSAWINGGVSDWAASDAFGARRFDVVVPLLAAGLAAFVAALARTVARAPLIAPALLLLGLTVWNAGFVALFRKGAYSEAAPLERLARDQARHLRLTAQHLLGAVLGVEGRALAYKYFSAEYVYSGNPAGTINLGEPDDRFLMEGWGTRGRRPDGPSYRWALYPQACLRLPLEGPFPMTATLTIRAPRRAAGQVVTVLVNERVVASSAVTADWQDLPVEIPASDLVPGENRFCMRFRTAGVGEEATRVAAAVATLQLP